MFERFLKISRDVLIRSSDDHAVAQAILSERQRIGQDLHDTFGQELTALNLLIQTLKEDPVSGGHLFDRVLGGLQRCRDQLRLVLQGLFPVPVESIGLMSALFNLAQLAEKYGQLPCSFDCPHPVEVEDHLVATQMYLIAQEAVHNAIKHARATNIWIGLECNDYLTLQVRDNGSGLLQSQSELDANGGFGLRIMRNRAALIHAALSIEENLPSGTIVKCTRSRLKKGPTENEQSDTSDDCRRPSGYP